MSGARLRLGDGARLIGVRPLRCWRKARWPSQEDAERNLARLQSAPHVRKPGWLNVYQCRYCDAWHVGHSDR